LIWVRLAFHFHTPVEDFMRRTSSRQFLVLQEYLREEPNEFHRTDYYLAQIAKLICRNQVKNPEKLETEDFLLRFKEPEIPTPEDEQAQDEVNKQAWLGTVGL
jgi:hypothetical protein